MRKLFSLVICCSLLCMSVASFGSGVAPIEKDACVVVDNHSSFDVVKSIEILYISSIVLEHPAIDCLGCNVCSGIEVSALTVSKENLPTVLLSSLDRGGTGLNRSGALTPLMWPTGKALTYPFRT